LASMGVGNCEMQRQRKKTLERDGSFERTDKNRKGWCRRNSTMAQHKKEGRRAKDTEKKSHIRFE